jgi:hypothetical protein
VSVPWNRVAMMYEGEIVGIVPPKTPVDELGLMMAGAAKVKSEKHVLSKAER